MKNRCFYNLCIKTSGKPQKIPEILFRIGDFMYWTDSVRWNNKKKILRIFERSQLLYKVRLASKTRGRRIFLMRVSNFLTSTAATETLNGLVII